MDKMSPEKQLTRRDFLRAAATAAAGSLVACLPRSTAIPTPESQSTPVPTAVPTEVPTLIPVVNETEKAIKRTTLDSNLTDVSGDVLLQGMGGKEAPGFGKPIITESLTATEIEAARALLGQKNAGTLYAVENGKAVIQRIISVDPVTGIDYSTETDESKVPFRVTVTMLPNTFLQADGERRILPEKTKPGEARYIKTNDQTEWNVTSTFLIDPGFLPTGAAFWWDMSGMNLRPVMWDGDGNPRLMENLPVEVKLAVVSTPTPEPTPTSTEVPKQETITFELTNGTKLEMPQFQTVEEALDFVQKNTLWRTGNKSERNNITISWLRITPEGLAFFKKIKMIPGYQLVFGTMDTFPEEGDMFFTLRNYKVNGGKTLLVYKNAEDKFEAICINIDSSDFVNQLPQFQFATPTPQP